MDTTILEVVAPPGLHKYPVIVLPDDGAALTDNVAVGVPQVMLLEAEHETTGGVVFATRTVEELAVQPFTDWVTVTVYVPAVEVVKLEVV